MLLVVVAGPGRAVVVLPSGTSQAVLDLLLVVLSVTAAVLLCRRALLTARAGRGARAVAPWAAYGAAMVFYSAAQVRFAWVELVLGGDPRREPLTSAGYLVVALLIPVAMVLAVRAAHASTSRLRTLLDGLLAGGGLFLLGWLGLVAPALSEGTVTRADVVLASGSVLSAVAVTTATLVLAARCRPPASVQLLATASLVAAAGQLAYLLLVRSGEFVPGGWPAVGNALSLVLASAAAVARGGAGRPWGRELTGGVFAGLPYVPFASAVPTVLVAATQRQLGLVELSATLLLTAVLVLRQALVVVENRRLARELQLRSDALTALAYSDQLTGLANRAAFTEALDAALVAAEGSGRAVVVAFCDLDGFKAVNDTCGHAEGDALLVAVAQRVRTAVRAEDVVARLGGDEFAVLVADAAPLAGGEQAAAELRQRLLASLAVPFSGGAGVAEPRRVLEAVSASVGVAASSELPTDLRTSSDALVREADQRMYAAKRQLRQQRGAGASRQVPHHLGAGLGGARPGRRR
ncbi:GGDEF domain-containing protein [Quadrisphaera setariae]|uniref:GGDEF domain-containing protein n=1 Tax=Quadrisphaera setariae TaxID=2593304 RepID=A0A5C8Z3Z5_9ACTN|nr:diguanylate cyclase [Quadrisphaera setariae]TXR51660.1 GGDEF domain-containing protein [Quadrisphaera setariae]